MSERPTLYFHIGGHKTGTTFLQNVLWHNRAELRRAGLLIPGHHRSSHVWANLDLRRRPFRLHVAPEVPGAWRRLVDEIDAWQGPAIITQELFSLLSAGKIELALRDLSFADVHVLFTARDMARQIPAAWQEWIKNQRTTRFNDLLVGLRDPESPERRRFMGMHDVPAILERWAAQVPADHIHVITVPPAGADRDLLWRRFAGAIGVDPDRYTLTRGGNSSLGAAEAAVLRQLNIEIGTSLIWTDYSRLVKFGLSPALARRGGTRIELPEDAYEWAVDWAQHTVKQIAEGGYHVVGDVDDLIPRSRPTGLDPDNVPVAQLVEAATTALRVLLRRTRRKERPDAAIAAAATIIRRQATPAPQLSVRTRIASRVRRGRCTALQFDRRIRRRLRRLSG